MQERGALHEAIHRSPCVGWREPREGCPGDRLERDGTIDHMPRFLRRQFLQRLQFRYGERAKCARKPWLVRRRQQLKERREIEDQHLQPSLRPRGDGARGRIGLAWEMAIDGVDPDAQSWKIVGQLERRLALRGRLNIPFHLATDSRLADRGNGAAGRDSEDTVQESSQQQQASHDMSMKHEAGQVLCAEPADLVSPFETDSSQIPGRASRLAARLLLQILPVTQSSHLASRAPRS